MRILARNRLMLSRNFFNSLIFKDKLIQIRKSPYMFVFIYKQYSENFAFLILRILQLFVREVCKFPKNYANF